MVKRKILVVAVIVILCLAIGSVAFAAPSPTGGSVAAKDADGNPVQVTVAAVHAALFPMRFIYDCFSIPPACQTESRLILYLKPHKRYHPTGAGIGCIFLRSVLWMAKIETFVTIL